MTTPMSVATRESAGQKEGQAISFGKQHALRFKLIIKLYP